MSVREADGGISMPYRRWRHFVVHVTGDVCQCCICVDPCYMLTHDFQPLLSNLSSICTKHQSLVASAHPPPPPPPHPHPHPHHTPQTQIQTRRMMTLKTDISSHTSSRHPESGVRSHMMRSWRGARGRHRWWRRWHRSECDGGHVCVCVYIYVCVCVCVCAGE